jgi:hypothetical protein
MQVIAYPRAAKGQPLPTRSPIKHFCMGINHPGWLNHGACLRTPHSAHLHDAGSKPICGGIDPSRACCREQSLAGRNGS